VSAVSLGVRTEIRGLYLAVYKISLARSVKGNIML